jgi:hypothetical protein
LLKRAHGRISQAIARQYDAAASAAPSSSDAASLRTLGAHSKMGAFMSELAQSAPASSEEDATSLAHLKFQNMLHWKLLPVDLARVAVAWEVGQGVNPPHVTLGATTLLYRLALHLVHQALGGDAAESPLTPRVKQLLCAHANPETATADGTPTTHAETPEARSLDTATAAVFARYDVEIRAIVRHIASRFALAMARYSQLQTPEARDEWLGVARSVAAAAVPPSERRHLLFGVGKDVDPTSESPELRQQYLAYAQRMAVEQTRLVDIRGARLPFHGVFWRGDGPLPAGKYLGFYEGRIVTQCEIGAHGHSQHVLEIKQRGLLVDAAVPEEGNWARFMNDATYAGAARSMRNNCVFSEDGHVLTTELLQPGDELLVEYGADYWKSHRARSESTS